MESREHDDGVEIAAFRRLFEQGHAGGLILFPEVTREIELREVVHRCRGPLVHGQQELIDCGIQKAFGLFSIAHAREGAEDHAQHLAGDEIPRFACGAEPVHGPRGVLRTTLPQADGVCCLGGGIALGRARGDDLGRSRTLSAADGRRQGDGCAIRGREVEAELAALGVSILAQTGDQVEGAACVVRFVEGANHVHAFAAEPRVGLGRR